MKSKLLWIILAIGILVSAIIGFYIWAGINFGSAIPKMVRDIDKAEKKWKSEKVNPLDSIETTVIKVIDSTRYRDSINNTDIKDN